ncbi:hypothetical protein BCR36DRAFT_588551, partial [Piromyces finnis]
MANLQSTIDLIEKSQALRLSYEALCKNNKNEKENINTSSLKKQNKLNCKNIEITKLLNQSNDSLKLKEKEEKENVIQKENLRNESKNLKEVLKTEIKKNMKQVDSLKKKLLTYDSEVNNCRDIINKQSKDLLNLKALLISKDKTIIETQQNYSDKSEKDSISSGSTIDVNDIGLVNDKIDDVNDILKNIIEEYHSLRSQISECQDINKSMEKNFSGMIDEKQRNIKEQIQKTKELQGKIDKLTKENNELNTILNIYNDQYIENHPYPFNKDIHQLCVNYQNELDNKGKIEKELKNIKIEMNDKDILLNEKLEKLNILNEKYTKCQEEYTTINDKYKSLETKSFYDNNELKRQLDELSNKNEKLESTLDVIKK